jgi:hypothetical protein
VVVNDHVTFVPLPATFQTAADATGCPEDFHGTFRFRARLTNPSTSPPLVALVVAVTTLTHGNLVQNAVEGPGDGGVHVPVPQEEGFADGVLRAEESVEVPFLLCLRQLQPFRFLVDVLGVIDTGAEAQTTALREH